MAQNLETQFMANLPDIRLAPFTPPFHNTACDYFVPIVVKVSRNRTAKHYGVLFPCLNTRAVHFELAVDCSTMEFLQALRRFFAIRGTPAVMISDNGTQLIGTEKELKEMVQGWKLEELREFCAEKDMEWRFTTPKAPHHNGCVEALVKTCKKALKKAIGNKVLSPFELYLNLLEAANLVNSRPIGRVPNDPDDGTYISPNDIYIAWPFNVRGSSRTVQTNQKPETQSRICSKTGGFFLDKVEQICFSVISPEKKMAYTTT